jgi:hypothetical protein
MPQFDAKQVLVPARIEGQLVVCYQERLSLRFC